MRSRIARVVGGLVLVLGVVGVVFVAGMRTNSPPVLNAVRRISRAMKPLAMKSAGRPGAYASVIRHVGRTTGRSYETPVAAVATDDGFVIALPYGANTDWLKNVVASGSATIVDERETYRVDRPEIVATAVAAPLFPAKDQRTPSPVPGRPEPSGAARAASGGGSRARRRSCVTLPAVPAAA